MFRYAQMSSCIQFGAFQRSGSAEKSSNAKFSNDQRLSHDSSVRDRQRNAKTILKRNFGANH